MPTPSTPSPQPVVTRADIRDGLRALGLQAGDAVGVHSSLSSLGHVDGGPDAVIDAFLDVLGPGGTLVFPTYSDNREELPVTPDERSQGLLMKIRAFAYDPDRAGCWTGAIPAAFLRRPGRTRGSHPTHSLAALGPRQNDFASRRWEALLDLDGHICMLGVGLGCCSAMHIAERDFVKLPDRILARLQPPRELVARHPGVTLVYGPYPDFSKMEEPLRRQGILHERRMGAANVMRLRLRELVTAYAAALREDADRFYV